MECYFHPVLYHSGARTALGTVCGPVLVLFPITGGHFGLLGFPDGSAGKESAYNAGDLGLIPGLGRSPGEGNGYPLQYSGLESSMDCIGHGWAHKEVDTTERLSVFTLDCILLVVL